MMGFVSRLLMIAFCSKTEPHFCSSITHCNQWLQSAADMRELGCNTTTTRGAHDVCAKVCVGCAVDGKQRVLLRITCAADIFLTPPATTLQRPLASSLTSPRLPLPHPSRCPHAAQRGAAVHGCRARGAEQGSVAAVAKARSQHPHIPDSV